MPVMPNLTQAPAAIRPPSTHAASRVPIVMRRRDAVSLTLLIALIVSTAPASAQAVYGSIAGTLTDSSGATVADVVITITSVERNTVDAAVSDASGFFRKDRLLPGIYGVAAVRAGFKTANAPSISVSLDTETRVALVLQPGPITETLIVEAPGLLLKTDRADVSTAVGGQAIGALPDLDRNFTRFLLLTPGATAVPWQHGSSENPQGSVQIMVNGQHFGGTGYQLDGTENRDPMLGIIVHQSEPRRRGGGKGHVTELRRGVRAGDGGRRVGADQVRVQRSCPAVCSSSTAAIGSRPATRSHSHRTNRFPEQNGTSSEARSEGQSGRTDSSYSRTTRDCGAWSAGRSCSRSPRCSRERET